MRSFLIIILTAIILFSCTQTGKQSKLVQDPVLEPFFTEDHFSYANDMHSDSPKLVYTSETTIMEYASRYFLRNCDITKRDDSLLFQFNDAPFSASMVQLDISKVHDQFVSSYYQTFSINDTSYRPPVFKTIYQNIILNKASYQKGDSLKGKFIIKIAAYHSWLDHYTDTVNIYGLVKNIVK